MDQILFVFLVMPLAMVLMSVLALLRGSKLALVPLGIAAALGWMWFDYYLTRPFSNPGGPAGLFGMFIPVSVGLVIAALALARTTRKA